MDAMVTARMPKGKKEAAAQVFKELGLTASQVINELFDQIIATRSVPSFEVAQQSKTAEQLYAEAEEWADSFPHFDVDDNLLNLNIKEIRALRIADKYGIVFDDEDDDE